MLCKIEHMRLSIFLSSKKSRVFRVVTTVMAGGTVNRLGPVDGTVKCVVAVMSRVRIRY